MSHRTTVGSSLAQVTCETRQVLLAGGQMVFLGDFPFFPILRLTWFKMSEIILTGRKTQIKKRRKYINCVDMDTLFAKMFKYFKRP